MGRLMKDIGKMEKCKEKDCIFGKMEEDIKGNT
jgi:hypothetical protein